MSRFWITTATAVTVLFAIGGMLDGGARWLAVGVLLTVYLSIVGLGITYIRLQFFGPAVCRLPAGERVVALTFDDGPHPATTPALLELLRREAVPATFFCIGRNVEKWPDLARRIVTDGHMIANHTQNHSKLLSLSFARKLRDEIIAAQASIVGATGVTPSLFRPPMGMTNPHFPGVARAAGVTTVGWDVRSLDTMLPADRVIARVVRQVRPGSIVLLHDGGVPTEKVLAIAAGVIGRLRAGGYRFVRLELPLDT